MSPRSGRAYLKFRAGWADSLTNLTSGLNANVRSGVNDFLCTGRTRATITSLRTGNDRAETLHFRARRLAIWHIDELGDNENQGMTANSRYECSIVQG